MLYNFQFPKSSVAALLDELQRKKDEPILLSRLKTSYGAHTSVAMTDLIPVACTETEFYNIMYLLVSLPFGMGQRMVPQMEAALLPVIGAGIAGEGPGTELIYDNDNTPMMQEEPAGSGTMVQATRLKRWARIKDFLDTLKKNLDDAMAAKVASGDAFGKLD